MGKKTRYENVIFHKRQGTLSLSTAGLSYRSTDDDDFDGEALKYKVRWGVIQNWTLNKRDAPKAMLRVSVLAEDEGEEEERVTFRVATRAILEELRDEMDARKEKFEQKAAAKNDGLDPPENEPSESMDDSAFDSLVRWTGRHSATRNNYQDSFAFEESMRFDGSERYSQNAATAIPPVIPENDYIPDNNNTQTPSLHGVDPPEDEYLEKLLATAPGEAPGTADDSAVDINNNSQNNNDMMKSSQSDDIKEKADNNSYQNEALPTGSQPVEEEAESDSVIRVVVNMDSSSSEDDENMAPPVYLEQQDSMEDNGKNMAPAPAPAPFYLEQQESVGDEYDNMAPPVYLEQQDSLEHDYEDDGPVETPQKPPPPPPPPPPPQAPPPPPPPPPAIEQATEAPSEPMTNSQTAYPRRASQSSTPAPTVPVIASRVNLNGSVYGTSKYFTPTQGVRLIAEAEFEEYAPCPCICFNFCVNYKMRKRTYFRVYENRTESNLPWAPFCCCSDERCMEDNIRVRYFDRSPNRSGLCCKCIPCTCCGPPVIYSYQPACCCGLLDIRPCVGEHILYAPYNCNDCRCCISCGTPCYTWCSVPVFPALGCLQATPMKNTEVLLVGWKGALAEYREFRNIGDDQGAVFKRVQDKFCECDSVKDIAAVQMDHRGSMKGGYLKQPLAARMDRLGSVKEGTQPNPTTTESIDGGAQPSGMQPIHMER